MIHQSEEGQGMDQCTMGLDTQMPQQDPDRQRTSNHMCARMENSEVVVHTTTNDMPSPSTTTVCAPKHFHKSTWSNYAESTLGNPFFWWCKDDCIDTIAHPPTDARVSTRHQTKDQDSVAGRGTPSMYQSQFHIAYQASHPQDQQIRYRMQVSSLLQHRATCA